MARQPNPFTDDTLIYEEDVYDSSEWWLARIGRLEIQHHIWEYHSAIEAPVPDSASGTFT